MTTTEKFHLAGFRAACRVSGIQCVVGGDVTLTALSARRKPDDTKLPPGSLSAAPQLFTCAVEDFDPLGLPARGNDIETDTARYRIASIDLQGPLVILNCTEGVAL